MTSAVLVRELDVWVQEASASGCLIESVLPLAIGTVGQLEVEFGDGRRLEWFRICRVHPVRGTSRVRVFGAEFLPVAVASAESLRGAIGRLPASPQEGKPGAPGRSSADAGNSTADVVVDGAFRGRSAARRSSKQENLGQKVVKFRQRAPRAKDGNAVALTDGQGAPRVRGSHKSSDIQGES